MKETKTFLIEVCPGTLAEGYTAYSQTTLRNVFNGKSVSHILPYHSPALNEEEAEQFMENRNRISISGVQEKLSLILEKNRLRLTKEDEQGTYILKPIPRDLKKVDQVPANEHLTMQVARQVYGISTAENALVFFKDGTPAYITKRFDVKSENDKWGVEDFASLAEKTTDNGGADFKYAYSYEEMGMLIQKYVPAWRVEIEKYFCQIVFNYLFSNGDAHLKNFSLLESTKGDYLLSPSYDLINTRIHVADTDFALNKGLFAYNFKSGLYRKNGSPGKTDFIEFGKRIGVSTGRIEKLLLPFLQKQELVEQMIKRSFLNESAKQAYLIMYNTRRNLLNT